MRVRVSKFALYTSFPKVESNVYVSFEPWELSRQCYVVMIEPWESCYDIHLIDCWFKIDNDFGLWSGCLVLNQIYDKDGERMKKDERSNLYDW